MSNLRRILVVEDDEGFREFIQSALEELGYQCVLSEHPAVLLKGSIPEADCVILDLIMPEVDGIEVLRAFADKRSQARVILMSGIERRVLEMAERTARALGLNVAGALQKPFRIAQLREAMQAAAGFEQTTIKKIDLPEIGETELRVAIARQQFEVYFQPQIRFPDHKVVGFEGLARLETSSSGSCPARPIHPSARGARFDQGIRPNCGGKGIGRPEAVEYGGRR
jgi:CheY-like chemotaxis protein